MEWSLIIKKLQQSKKGNFERLEHIKNILTQGKMLYKSDKDYLEHKIKEYSPQMYTQMYQSHTKSRQPYKPRETFSYSYNSPPQTILIDEFEEKPTKNFESLSNTVANIIRDSSPHFTIGVYGDWGTGKTTLMKAIEKNLLGEKPTENQKIVSVWFNGWRFEHEETLAIHAILRTISYELSRHPAFSKLSRTISAGLRFVDSDMMPKITYDLLKEDIEKNNRIDQRKLTKNISYLDKLQRQSIYFDGLNSLRNKIDIIRDNLGKDYRVVVFIDDLDRCSPRKALEILESIKLFLDIEGFVFVIGMSHKTASQLITHSYKTTGIKGEDYIKKIIQIPIKIPQWSKESISELIEKKICTKLNDEYATFLRQNPSIVSQMVGANPRQLKRFINNVIVAFETFSRNGQPNQITLNEIYLVQILKSEWPDFYDEFVKSENFRKMMRWAVTDPKELKKYFKYLEFPEDEHPIEQKQKRLSILADVLSETGVTSKQIEILSKFNNSTWRFLGNVKEILFTIQDWDVLDSVMDVIEDLHYNVHLKPKTPDTPTPPTTTE